MTSEIKELHSNEEVDRNGDYSERTNHKFNSHALQECVHGLRPSDKDTKILKDYLASGNQKINGDAFITEHRSFRTEKVTPAHGIEDARNDRKGKGRYAHILTLVLMAESGKNKSYDTEPSELSSRYALTRRSKIISEEDFKGKKGKFKMKLVKRYM